MTQTVDTLRADIAALGEALVKADSDGNTESATKYARAREKAKKRLALVESNPAEYDPESEAFQDRYGATAGMSRTERFAAGFDKAVSDLGTGLKQRGLEAANFIPGVDLDQILEKTRTQVERSRERDAALLRDNFGFAGNLVGDIVSKAPAMATGPGFARAGTAAALEGLARPSTSAEETGINTAMGGVFGIAGEGVSRGIGRLFRPVADSASDSTREAINVLQREGIDLDVGQRTASSSVRGASSALSDNPITRTSQANFIDRQRRQFTRAVLRTIADRAEDAPEEVTGEFLNSARRSVSRQIDDAARRTPAAFDTELVNALDVLDDRAVNSLLPEELALFRRQTDAIRGAAVGGRIPGNQFTNIRSNLGGLKPRQNIGGLARELDDELMLSLERGGGDSNAIRDAMAKYRNIKILENSIDKDAERLVSPLRLSTTLNTLRNRTLFQRGIGHERNLRLAELARSARGILPDATPQSGTFPRLLMGEGLLFAGGTGAAAASGQDISDAAKIGAGVAAAPIVLQRLLNSQGLAGRLLSEGLPGQAVATSPLVGTLSRQGATSLGLLSEEQNR